MRYFLYLIFCLSFWVAQAQQSPQFGSYAFNGQYYNPALVGQSNRIEILGLYRLQYAGYQATADPNGAPVTQLFSISSPVAQQKGGIGLQVVNDVLGGGRVSRELTLAGAYHLPIGINKLSLGASVGFLARGLNGTALRPRDEEDPLLPTTQVLETQPDVGLGVAYSGTGFSLGLGVRHLTQPTFSLGGVGGENQQRRMYHLTGQYLIGLTYTWDLQPMALVRFDGQKVATDVGLLALYDQVFWGGISYRHEDAISLLAGINLLQNRMKLGYVFDYVVAGVAAKSLTSHEIMLQYALPAPKPGKRSIIRTPRYSF
ncbi:MAG: type IX secretion system membrane protein PorP/SprF [Spirosomataceae bacterium]